MSQRGPFMMGCGAGFSGDRVDAPVSVIEAIATSGRPGAIMFETLAERTLALGHVARRLDPEHGYEPLLEELVGPILARCLRSGIPIVGNFGAANPQAAARRLKQLAAERGLPEPRIAIVEGDDITDSIDLSTEQVFESDAGLLRENATLIAANAYLGARPIAEALLAGAEIVVTGRVADPSLALGPLAAHFGWAWDDLDRLAAGTLAGHLLECGSQVTGGYFADPGFKDVPRPAEIGFPIAEVWEDGRFVITKAPGTGGRVDKRTVTEQILYEMHDPAAYLTPDVTLDITGVSLASDGPDRVVVQGARGHAAPPTLKATVSFEGDWIGEAEISYAGPNALARARLAAATIADRLTLRQLPVKRRLDLIGALSVFDDDAGTLAADAPDAPEIRVRLAVSGQDRRPVEQSLQEVLALLCCGPAGGGGQRQQIRNRIRTVSYLVPRDRVAPRFVFA
ncbi:MAG: acyclic terpene utilization AtuA family protein [Acetobacteraceae bacterium]|nr:acyclic terpene utilization AtuA family protein [Acetobacteraceae bacterium]